jgi:hypothetical protein
LKEHVRAGGSGLIIDESSSPRDSEFKADSIWNRPVYSHLHTRRVLSLPLADLGLLLIARYPKEVLESAAIQEDRLLEARRLWEQTGGAAHQAYEAFLTSEMARRMKELKFEAAKLPPGPDVETASKAYENAKGKFDEATESYFDLVRDLQKRLRKLPADKTIDVEYNRLEVRFPRNRKHWSAEPSPLTAKSFVFVRAKGAKGWGAKTWNVFEGDYPPDMAIVPPKDSPSKNLTLLRQSLRDCTPLTQIRSALEDLSDPKRARAFWTTYGSGCVTTYLNADRVKAALAAHKVPWNEAAWQKARRSCAALWPASDFKYLRPLAR